MAYYQLEPFGPLRWALYAATVVIACLSPWRKKSSSRMKPGDVFPELEDAGRGRGGLPTVAELREKVRRWAQSAGRKAF